MKDASPEMMSIFCAALERVSAEERSAYVAAACGQDADLRSRIDALLQAHEKAGDFLPEKAEDPNVQATIDPPPASDRPGTVMGPYKLLQQIGEGGMGTVWMAEQTEPVQRKVALKLIKSGMDSRQVIARFEAERQALALMDHPNIAKVLDAGTVGAEPEAQARDSAQSLACASGSVGRPYFVMELVKGVPITKYCDEHHLTPRQRLELFVPVCQAVQHAHQKGIIHRDLKPSNVMVCLYDGRPVPKVIDFGVAKAAGPRLTEKTLFTELGQVVGTLEYMSPEQAELNQLDIDTRSDIYSLGVLLYELLTGTTPLERKRFQAVAFLEVLRLIREEESPKPSTRLSTAEGLPSIAANRGLEPKKLSGLMRGELDWIVMKTLEKDRSRRYETANGFAMDVQRYLADEPVLAGPPSARYRLKKFLRRNRGPVLAGMLVLLALVVGIIGTTVGLLQAQASGDEARAEAWKAGQERDAAKQARDEERKAKEAQSVLRQLAEAARDRAANTLDAMTSSLASDALTRQQIITPEQKQFLTKALGYYVEVLKEKGNYQATRQRIAAAASRVGNIEDCLGRAEQAAHMFRKARDLYSELAKDFPDLAKYDFFVAESHINLGSVLHGMELLSQAETEFRAAGVILRERLAKFPGESKTRYQLTGVHHNLGIVLGALGKLDQSATEHRTAIDISTKLLNEHADVPEYRHRLANNHHNLGGRLEESGKLAEAESAYRAALEHRRQLVAKFPANPRYRQGLAEDRLGLAKVLTNPAQAAAEHAAALELQKKLVAAFPAVPHYRLRLADIHTSKGTRLVQLRQLEAAEAEFRAAGAINKELVDEYPAVPAYGFALAADLNALGLVLDRRGKPDQAEPEYRTAIAIQKKLTAKFPAVTGYAITLAGMYCNLGVLLENGDRPSDALSWYAQAIATSAPIVEKEPKLAQAREFLLKSHWGRARTFYRLARYDESAKDWARAMELAPVEGKTFLHVGLMLSRLGAGQFEAALKDADLLARSDAPDVIYDCACAYALAHAKTKDDKHAARAVVLLRQAVAKGFRDVAHVKKDADFDSIRNRDDFRQFLVKLEAKSKESNPKR